MKITINVTFIICVEMSETYLSSQTFDTLPIYSLAPPQSLHHQEIGRDFCYRSSSHQAALLVVLYAG